MTSMNRIGNHHVHKWLGWCIANDPAAPRPVS